MQSASNAQTYLDTSHLARLPRCAAMARPQPGKKIPLPRRLSAQADGLFKRAQGAKSKWLTHQLFSRTQTPAQ